MGEKGKKLCTGNYRHIDIRYFFAKDRVKSNKMSIAYCRTQHMVADKTKKKSNPAWIYKEV